MKNGVPQGFGLNCTESPKTMSLCLGDFDQGFMTKGWFFYTYAYGTIKGSGEGTFYKGRQQQGSLLVKDEKGNEILHKDISTNGT